MWRRDSDQADPPTLTGGGGVKDEIDSVVLRHCGLKCSSFVLPDGDSHRIYWLVVVFRGCWETFSAQQK